MSTTRIIRLDDEQVIEVGQMLCLVEVHDLEPVYGTPAHERRWNELDLDPRTNQSGEPRAYCWLGTTNGVQRVARGWWLVTSTQPWDETSTGVQRVRARLVEVAK